MDHSRSIKPVVGPGWSMHRVGPVSKVCAVATFWDSTCSNRDVCKGHEPDDCMPAKPKPSFIARLTFECSDCLSALVDLRSEVTGQKSVDVLVL
eukprot:scaffold650_cov407-Prasinococcus_capsulatus_cf.AAC.12